MDYPPDQRGRCMTCGFLAQRLTEPAFEPALREVNEKQRSAFGAEVVVPGHSTVRTVPTCYVKAFNLEAEYDRGNSAEMVRQMFDKDRKCPKWSPYTPGFSPKEHLEQQRAEKAEINRREFEQRLEKSRRWFEIKITAFLAFIALLSVPWWPQLFGWLQRLISKH